MRDRILAIYDEIEALQAEQKRLLEELRKDCPHEHIVYRDWYSTKFLNSFHDYFMICLVCGYEVEGGQWEYDLPDKLYGERKSRFKTAIKVGKDDIFKYRKLRPLTEKTVIELPPV